LFPPRLFENDRQFLIALQLSLLKSDHCQFNRNVILVSYLHFNLRFLYFQDQIHFIRRFKEQLQHFVQTLTPPLVIISLRHVDHSFSIVLIILNDELSRH